MATVVIAGDSGSAPSQVERARNVMVVVAAFLAVEPALRAATAWWRPGLALREFLHTDVLWLVLILIPLMLSASLPDVRTMVRRHSWLLAGAGIWAVAAVVSSWLAAWPELAALRSARWVLLLAVALGLAVMVQRAPDRSIPLLITWCLGFATYAVVMMAFIAYDPIRSGLDWVWQLPGQKNVRHLPWEAVAAVIVGGLARPAGLPKFVQVPLQFAALLGWAAMFWSGGRSGMLGAMAGITALLIVCQPGERLRRAMETLIIAAAGFLLSTLHTPADGAFGGWRSIGFTEATVGVPDPTSGRTALWSETIATIAAHPLTGIGEAQTVHRLQNAGGVFAQPHNLFLQAWLAWGLIGGTAFLLAIAFAYGRALKRLWKNAAIGSPAAAGFAIATALLATSMLDGPLYHPRSVFLFLLGLCLAYAGPRTVVRQ
jgi:O-antigen ligase